MVRSYARLLKLDEAPLLERLEGRFAAPDSDELAARFLQPVPFSDSGRRSTLLYLGLSLAVLAFVGLSIYQWRREASAPPAVAAAPSEPVPPRPAPQPAQAQPVQPKPAAAIPAPKPAAAPPAAAADAQKSIGSSRIVLRCEEESWIEVKDSADRVLISSLNAAGSERVVQGRPPFSLIIGNAQHVRLSYNDQPVDLQPHIKVEVARFTLN
jgi:cytoskeleton protein RodZ